MKRFLLTMAAILLSCYLPIVAHGKAWRGIVPLQSKRSDVERVLGEGTRGHYQFDDERVHVNYAGEGKCSPVNGCLCLVPQDTVISIYVQPEVKMSFSRLKIDKKKYEKYVSSTDPTVATYSNKEQGIIYTADQQNDDVIAIEYLPTAKDCQDMLRPAKHAMAKNLPSQAAICLRDPDGLIERNVNLHSRADDLNWSEDDLNGRATSWVRVRRKLVTHQIQLEFFGD
jgi:hypothetical protein